jgi:predicted metal-dependent phosphoesterase TrpH
MLKFTRTKLVSIYRKNGDFLTAQGILEDDIYGLELVVTLGLPNLEILSIEGAWKRAENRECVRAIPFLQEAVGFRLEEGFSEKVKKIVGQKACRHFAEMLLECCYAAREAAQVIKEEAEKERAETVPDEDRQGKYGKPVFFTANARPDQPDKLYKTNKPGKPDLSEGIFIDLHTHTYPASPCSSVEVDDLIKRAKQIGLGGLCLTDHNHVWDQKTVADLGQKHHFLILRGNEITTDQGDMIVFGLEKEIRGIIRLEELKDAVLRVGGFIVCAHPFRGFLTFGVGKLGLTPEKAMERPLFKLVDAVEVMNGKVTEKENALAQKVAAGLDLPITGGSDAHEVSAVGTFVTWFPRAIKDEKELMEALKTGNYSPIAFKKERSS